ncbi:MAG: hypothetical protein HFJ47_03620 [Clostridia bacterium]|nr:hypothetical protein [Clostridia bacterium]
MKNILSITMVIIGALIGAGFASGQEIYAFFYKNGISGLIGTVISSILIGYIIYKVFIIVKKYQVNNYREFLETIMDTDKTVKIEIINKIIEILILITFFIMMAGFGAYFEQEYRINSIIGSAILAGLCFSVFITNVDGFIKISKFIVPILVVFIVLIGILNTQNIELDRINCEVIMQNMILGPINAIMYASYNTILLIPVLITLNQKIKKYKEIKYISIISSIIIFILTIIIFFLLSNITIDIKSIEMPIVYIIANNFRYFKNMYAIIILISIFTTAVSLGISYLENNKKNRKSYTQTAAIMCITSIFFSKIGFSNLINLLYPIFGILGLIQIDIIFKKKVNKY